VGAAGLVCYQVLKEKPKGAPGRGMVVHSDPALFTPYLEANQGVFTRIKEGSKGEKPRGEKNLKKNVFPWETRR